MSLPISPGSDPALAAALDAMKGQMLIVLVNRLGGEVEIPVAEVDATGGWMLDVSIDQAARTFTFKTTRKS
jgi:hypothetical protein